MADYVLLSTGHGKMPEGEEAMTAFMVAWEAWAGGLGAALKDPGKPFSSAKSIDPSGVVGDGSLADCSGYSIFSADSMEDAVEIAQRCPVLLTGNGISLYETSSMGDMPG